MKKITLGELIANAVSHGIGVLLSVVALVLMIIKADQSIELIGAIVFGVSLIILYLSSTLLHSFPEKMSKVTGVFRRLDHSSIFILIAGTYTPFLLIIGNNTASHILLGILWGVTIIGIVMKSIWIKKFHVIHLLLYLVMGWSILFVYSDLFPSIRDIFPLILVGGLCYTIGVIFYISKFKYQHFIWHLFVLGGSMFHFFSIYLGLL